ncbi:hypothetical protein DNTS_025639, partial [Danionella cerebrum]
EREREREQVSLRTHGETHSVSSSISTMTRLLLCLFVTFWRAVPAIHPDCDIISQLIQDQETCVQTRKREIKNQFQQPGCATDWDGIRCWHRANAGQLINVSCAELFQHISNTQDPSTLHSCVQSALSLRLLLISWCDSEELQALVTVKLCQSAAEEFLFRPGVQ